MSQTSPHQLAALQAGDRPCSTLEGPRYCLHKQRVQKGNVQASQLFSVLMLECMQWLILPMQA